MENKEYSSLAKSKNFESLLLEEKGDRSGVPRNEFASFGGSRIAVDEVYQTKKRTLLSYERKQ